MMIHKSPLPFLITCSIAASSLLQTASAGKLRQPNNTRRLNPGTECTLMVSARLAIDPESNDFDETFDCAMDDGKIFPIQASSSQKAKLQEMLGNGEIIASQSGLAVGGAMFSETDGFILPPGQDIASSVSHRPEGLFGRKLAVVTGDKPILVVKVTDSAGRARSESSAVISDDIFGTGTDTINLKSQMSGCSFGQLNVVPGSIDASKAAAAGVVEVTIAKDLTLVADRYEVHNAVTPVVNALLGITLPGPYQQVMYVLENCYVDCGWAAYAYVNSWMSVYQGGYYKQAGVQMHEIGHNLNLAHSGGLNGATYTDHTCLMGNPLYGDDLGQMCFNAAKTWQIGWYNSNKVTWNQSLGPMTYTLVGIANFDTNTAGHPVVVKIETGTTTDQFIAFNRATGVNIQNKEADDEVTVVETDNNGEGYSQSYLKATLLQGEAFVYSNWAGTGKMLTITATKIDSVTNPSVWTAEVRVELETPPTNPPTPIPTKSPVPPTPLPTRAPVPPTPLPTTSPTLTCANIQDATVCRSLVYCSWAGSGKNRICISNGPPSPTPPTTPPGPTPPTNPPVSTCSSGNCGGCTSKGDCGAASCSWFKGACV